MEGDSQMDDISISNSISRNSIYESMSMSRATMEDASGRLADGTIPDAISNEQIRKGDEILETYRVEGNAIHGGMGSVWCVHHNSWNVSLAMKRPQPRFFAEGSEKRKEEFVSECENWINLGLHPNIVSCYYVREIGGIPSIFSEWMDGGSLKDVLASGKLYEGAEADVQERILHIAIQTARGLAYSHEKGLVHQDIKPGNILLTDNWDAKIADFGLAQARSRLSGAENEPLSIGGTLQYCPMEQAKGAAAEEWMDLYAWALTVTEMYSGQRLWETGADAKQHIEEILGSCKIGCPASLSEALQTWLACSDNRNVFNRVEETLLQIYKNVTGKPYPIEKPVTAGDTADSLNNRALSYLDLGFSDQAEELLQAAVHQQNDSPNAVFNYALLRWRRGSFTDAECISFLQEHLGDDDDTITEIRRERGYESGLTRICQESPPFSAGYEFISRSFASDIHAAINSNHVGIEKCRGWSDPKTVLSVFSCDEKGLLSQEILQVETGENDSFGRFSLINGTIIDLASDGVYFFRTGESKPYHIIREENAYWRKHIIEDDHSHIIVLTKETAEGDSLTHYRVERYESLRQLTEKQKADRTEIRISDEFDQAVFTCGRLFLIGFDRLIILDAQMKSQKEIQIPSIEHAILRNRTLYIFAEDKILAFDTETLEQKETIPSGTYAHGRSAVSSDERYIITFESGHLKIYDTQLKRCAADWHEDRFREWEKVIVITDCADAFTLHIKNKVYDHSEHGYTPEYIHETYSIPVPGDPCTWRLSRIQSSAERLEAEKAFEKLLRDAENALKAGDASACLRLLDSGYRMKGFEQSKRLRSLNAAAGKGRELTGIRYIQKAAMLDNLSSGEEPICLSGQSDVLTHCIPEGPDASEYRLINWESKETLFRFSAAKDSSYACSSRDGTLAVAFESVTQEHFTVLKMNLLNGNSERISISAAANPDRIRAATDGTRILILTGHHCIVIGSDNEYQVTAAEDESMAFGCFSPGGDYFAKSGRSPYSSNSKLLGQGVALMRASTLSADPETVFSADMFGISELDVNQAGIVLSQGILLFPDPAGFAVRCSAEYGEIRREASAFTPDGSGFVVVGNDGSLSLFMPMDGNDYRIKVQDSDPRKQIVYEKPMKILMLDAAERIHGASDIAANGKIMFNGNGTAFLDADKNVWVIDYRYSESKQRSFLPPPHEKASQTDEYIKNADKFFKPEAFLPDKKGKSGQKTGFLAKLFGRKH